MVAVNTCFLSHPSRKNSCAYTTHTHPLRPPTEKILWIVLLSNLLSHGSLNFATLRPSLFLNKIRYIFQLFSGAKKNNDFFKRPQSVTCVHCTCDTNRWTHRVSSLSKHPPDSTHLCFNPSWHQVGICWFFNICKSLQTAALGQIFTTGPSGAYANDCTTTEPNMRF